MIAGAPHTSNWDFIFAMAAIMALDLEIHWIGKHTIFKPPFKNFLFKLGGIPLDRSRAEGVVKQTATVIRNSDKMVIGIMPEGTRKRVEKFKTGIFRIAFEAKCPILMAGLDYNSRRIILGDMIEPREDFDAQAAELKEQFRQFTPKNLDNF